MDYTFIANWKMNFTFELAHDFCEKLENSPAPREHIILSVPELYLLPLKQHFRALKFASQDVSIVQEKFGSYTGEVSAYMLKEHGINHTIIGHSERRKYFNETNEIIKSKINNCINAGITPIVCVGESRQERENGVYLEAITQQIHASIPPGCQDYILAYEPLWSIGTGIIPSHEQIEEITSYLYQEAILENDVKIVYGGSVESKNVRDILNIPGISGVLIGKASLDAEEFIKLCLNGV
ncbi:MAG: tpiA [Rickettsiaceae bacterium]|jgi:triosephosphate isomerase|nr:tpiA [Rickettsiaceae bacterium]